MSKRVFKSQASTSRAVSGAFVSRGQGFSGVGGSAAAAAAGFGLSSSSSSPLSHVAEPPDLSGISEPNVVVALKNLSKRDSTTKAKALEDLQSYALSTGVAEGGVEDALLEAWVGFLTRMYIPVLLVMECSLLRSKSIPVLP